MILCSTNNRGQSRTVFVFSYFELWIAHKSSMPFMSFASVGVMDIYSYITDCVALIPLFTLLQYLLFATPWYNFVAISFFRKTFASHNLRWCHYLLHIVKQTALWCSETFNSFRSSRTACMSHFSTWEMFNFLRRKKKLNIIAIFSMNVAFWCVKEAAFWVC